MPGTIVSLNTVLSTRDYALPDMVYIFVFFCIHDVIHMSLERKFMSFRSVLQVFVYGKFGYLILVIWKVKAYYFDLHEAPIYSFGYLCFRNISRTLYWQRKYFRGRRYSCVNTVLTRTWKEVDYRNDFCRATKRAHDKIY